MPHFFAQAETGEIATVAQIEKALELGKRQAGEAYCLMQCAPPAFPSDHLAPTFQETTVIVAIMAGWIRQKY